MIKIAKNTTALLLALFGAVTLFLTSSVLFDWFGIRQKEGNYVPFIVQINFACSLLYLAAAWGMFKNLNWAKYALAASTLLVTGGFIALRAHIHSGGLYKQETVNGMMFRIGFSLLATAIAFYVAQSASKSKNF